MAWHQASRLIPPYTSFSVFLHFFLIYRFLERGAIVPFEGRPSVIRASFSYRYERALLCTQKATLFPDPLSSRFNLSIRVDYL